MNSRYYIKQITSLYSSCNKCGLPIINCLCDKAQKIKTAAKIWILSTEKEFYRPIISLETHLKSNYDLRRGSKEGNNLCTIETASKY